LPALSRRHNLERNSRIANKKRLKTATSPPTQALARPKQASFAEVTRQAQALLFAALNKR
jgi:hypothetical protein